MIRPFLRTLHLSPASVKWPKITPKKTCCEAKLRKTAPPAGRQSPTLPRGEIKQQYAYLRFIQLCKVVESQANTRAVGFEGVVQDGQ